MNEFDGHRPKQFLADLTQAMRATAEMARQATLEQCQQDALVYTEKLRARTAAATLQKEAGADVVAIRDWSKAAMDRIRTETEERVARRHGQLEEELQECSAAVETEVQRVDELVRAFEVEVAQFFEQLVQGTDPSSFATMAARAPNPPAFPELGTGSLLDELRGRGRAANEPVPASAEAQENLVDHWWLDSPAALAARARSIAETGRS